MNEESKKLSVLIAEQSPLIAEAICTRLNSVELISKINVVLSGDLSIIDLKKPLPDVVIIGIEKGKEEDSLDIIRLMRTQNHSLHIIINIEVKDSKFVQKAFLYGVSAVLSRNECTSYEIKKVIEYMCVGKRYLSDAVKNRIIDTMLYPTIPDYSSLHGINNQDIALINLLALGKTTQEIADLLDTTQYIVTARKRKLCKKLDAKNAPHLVLKALANNLISMTEIIE